MVRGSLRPAGYWRTRPLSWNIDDLRGIRDDFKTLLGPEVRITGSPPLGPDGDPSMREWGDLDLDDPHPIQCGLVLINARREAPDRSVLFDVTVYFGPEATTMEATLGEITPDLEQNLRQLQRSLRARATNARAHTIPWNRRAIAVTTAAQLLLIGLFAWLIVTWRSLPGLLLLAVLTFVLLFQLQPSRGGAKLLYWMSQRRPRSWLNLKSDAELLCARPHKPTGTSGLG